MKSKLALLFLALSIGSSSLFAKSSSAAPIQVRIGSHPTTVLVANRDGSRGNYQLKQTERRYGKISRYKRVWIPGHYEKIRHGRFLVRKWVKGHWEYRR